MKTICILLLLTPISLTLYAQSDEVVKAKTFNTQPRAEDMSGRGHLLQEEGDLSSAKEYYWKAIEIDSTNIDYFLSLGDICLQSQDYELASKGYDIAKRHFPDNSDIFYYSGDIFQKMGQYEKAISDYTNAIRICEQTESSFLLYLYYFNRGNTFLRMKQYQLAIEDYNSTLKIFPHHYGALSNRGMAKFSIRNREGACRDWEKAYEFGYEEVKKYMIKYCEGK
ncbi:tetratricopeptide repeat protein [Limibacter armeniacum]|uniref:tetratricopeptide repeat protein n=1 Tax=Limibacter armeniacum TaxID=466084 RepID=UPI002FE5F1B6